MWYCNRSFSWDSSIRSNWLKRNIILSIIFLSIYCINRSLKNTINIPYIDWILKCHLNDFIGGFIFCVYLNMILVLNNRKPISNFFTLIIIIFGVSVLWEYFFPIILPYSTSDFFDIIAYLLGACTFALFNYKLYFK